MSRVAMRIRVVMVMVDETNLAAESTTLPGSVGGFCSGETEALICPMLICQTEGNST